MKVKILITIDTEFYPLRALTGEVDFASDIGRDIYGETRGHDVGLLYQTSVLCRHCLKGIFLVESLCANGGARGILKSIVREIANAGHEIQLHLHPEWLQWSQSSVLVGRSRQKIREFTLEEQALLLKIGIQNLRDAGAKNVCAFRAGDFAANRDTLKALRANGIQFDTSYNACYSDSLVDVAELNGNLNPSVVEGLVEMPVTHWRDTLGNRRHAQLCSCSTGELHGALLRAWKQGLPYFVIVSHSFELLKKRRQRIANPAPDPIVVGRFEKLCQFLADNRDKFQTCGFNDIDVNRLDPPSAGALEISCFHTGRRMLEQAYRRLW